MEFISYHFLSLFYYRKFTVVVALANQLKILDKFSGYSWSSNSALKLLMININFDS